MCLNIFYSFLYYSGSQMNNSFNLFQKDWDAVLLERLIIG